ncbi:MAG: 16S rRNA (adenine(1518)-N(6)/adenine(1519)-N(6))-dimethyltransferase RsmA [Phycisphaerales bacterium]|nr:16S rRNA (adenine(1518)-N(6)/adenine(1519)-N(6))-dimethyltransferase RsmA [Phycisphaerales bacterium]
MSQTVSQIKAMLAARGLRPRKRFGQNFLIDPSKIDTLLDAAALSEGDLVLEVGPGTGVLTEALLERGAEVVACELDRDLASLLRERLGDRIKLVEGDCLGSGRLLSQALVEQLGDRSFKLVANLPYEAASPLMCTLAMHHGACLGQYVTIQKEVGDRLTAEPGTRAWGPLSVHVRRTCSVRRLCVLPPGCFWPRPGVTSAMVAIEPDRMPGPDAEAFAAFVNKLFSARRKQLGSTLGSAVVEAAGVDGARRAETLSIDELERLAEACR